VAPFLFGHGVDVVNIGVK